MGYGLSKERRNGLTRYFIITIACPTCKQVIKTPIPESEIREALKKLDNMGPEDPSKKQIDIFGDRAFRGSVAA
jgi:hypothetical protein